MAKGIQTANGKAFEYACILALYEELHSGQDIVVEQTESLHTAQKLYGTIEESIREALDAAARASVRIIKRLEPQLWNPGGCQPLFLSLQPDSAGIKGDVRDVLCLRKQNGWEIGLSCKHNHHAVKHSRLSDTIEVVCDGGWQISMRIHSASSKVEPSLKFDVNLISVPSSVHTQVEPWDTGDAKRTVRLGLYTELMLNNE